MERGDSRLTWATGLALTAIWAGACAIGTTGDDEATGGSSAAQGGGQAGGAGGEGSLTTTTSTTTTGVGAQGGESATGGAGGMGPPTCDPPEHLCSDTCEGNTPATGCYQSSSCSPCPSVSNGVAICDSNGSCAAQCNTPYVANGTTCTCPNQCCTTADCGANQTCDNGSCVSTQTCDQGLCIIQCAITNQVGLCVNDVCTCV